MGMCYVVKSSILGRKGSIEPGVVLRDTKEFTRIGVETSEMPTSIAHWALHGHIIACDETQLLDVIRGKKIMPPLSMGNPDGVDGNDGGSFRTEKDNHLQNNDPTKKFGWDPKMLEEYDVRQLQDMVKQIMPEIPDIEVRKIERQKAVDILSAQHPSRVNPHA